MRKICLFLLLLIILSIMFACGGKTIKDTNINSKSSTKSDEVSSGIISKSENTISDKETEEVLDKIDTELDSIFSSIDSLEDIDDSAIENIE